MLNAGASWCAYQVGALGHLVGERGWRFDVHAATGIAAMNAAFVACGRLAELERFWRSVTLVDLLPSRRRPFLAAHVSERALAERGATLLLTTLNLVDGRLEVLRYPGEAVPLVDGIIAAGGFPGAVTPLRRAGGLLVEGTLLDGVPMGPALAEEPDEVVAVLPGLPAGGGPLRRYPTWFSVLKRSVAANQTHDVRRGLAEAAEAAAEAEAGRRVTASLSATLGRWGAGDSAPAEGSGPRLVAVRPSQELPYPLWRFRRRQLDAAMALGGRDARAAADAADAGGDAAGAAGAGAGGR